MARRAVRFHGEEHRVAVAVDLDVSEMENVAARLALAP
jgi:hypothetical protein